MAETMYKGIAFSPQTEITDAIGAGDTVIPVANIAAFPDAPNYATIGTDEDGETVLYSAKTSDSLSGCTRGVEGTAKSWPSGTTIARNFTNLDFTALQTNIGTALTSSEEAEKDVEAILTAGPWAADTAYTAGNVVTYDGSTWRAKQPSTGQAPAENEYWTCIAQKGETGPAGYTPVKGTDYWTEADKTEMVNDVLASLTNADEVKF